MEITKNDLIHFKVNPTFIAFLKAIHFKDNEFLVELSKIVDMPKMAKILEQLTIIKILDDKIDFNSYEIRRKAIINYLNKIDESKETEKNINEVINYYKKVSGREKTSISSKANRKFIKARLEEYSVDDLKSVIDLKNKQCKLGKFDKSYFRIETLFNDTKFQGYIGEVEDNESEIDKIIPINKML